MSYDLVMCTHSSFDRSSHEIFRDAPFKWSQVMLENAVSILKDIKVIKNQE